MKKTEINSTELYDDIPIDDPLLKFTPKKDIPLVIVSTTYHRRIITSMISSFLETLKSNNKLNNFSIVEVPGAFEIPLIIKLIIEKYQPKQILALGCIIKGETNHDDYLASTVINALRNISLEHKTPIINGVLTANTLSQAIDRAGKKHNKGKDFANAYLSITTLIKNLKNDQF